jgi:ribosome-binding factor A
MITITDVEVTSDHEHAKVFFTRLGEASGNQSVVEALARAGGFIRSQLAKRMRLRMVPQIHFEYDESVERGVRLSKLIDEAVGGNHSTKS